MKVDTAPGRNGVLETCRVDNRSFLARALPRPLSHGLVPLTRLIQNFFVGNVSRTALLTKLLPLSFASFASTLVVGVLLFPVPYDWRERVISHLMSPRHNPEGYWVPSIGIAMAALLAMPFAGYVEQRLRAITPRIARSAGVAFALGLLLIASGVLPQFAPPVPGLRRLHETLARASAVVIAAGMVCCCLCALKDRFRVFGGQRLLRRALAFWWASLTLPPIACGIIIAAVLVGHKADLAWAVSVRGLLRPTMLGQLAFWEWVGVTALFVFLFVSALWLPERTRSPAVTAATRETN